MTLIIIFKPENIETSYGDIPEGEIRTKFRPLNKFQEGEAAYLIEAQRGELIHYTISDGKNVPYRQKIRAPTRGKHQA